MAPIPEAATLVARQIPDQHQEQHTWAAFVAENEQPTAAMCLTFTIVTLLVLGLLLYTGRRWEECNGRNSFRRRICPHCRENASARAAKLRRHSSGNLELDMVPPSKEADGASASWHGSNMLNTSWGWMS